ncbi:MAG: hypothetical protein ACE5HO_13610 [bacterium]
MRITTKLKCIIVIVGLHLISCGSGSSFRRAGETIYEPYPADHPVKLYYMQADFPGFEKWSKYFEPGQPPSRDHVVVGRAWVSAKTQKKWAFDKLADPMKGVEEFKKIARENGADAIIEIEFVGEYLTETPPGGPTYASPISEHLTGVLIRYTDKSLGQKN